MDRVVIVSGARTATVNFGGAFKSLPAIDLGALVIKNVLERIGARPVLSSAMEDGRPDKLREQRKIALEQEVDTWDLESLPIEIDEVIMGNVLQAGQGQNPARQAMLQGGIPMETPACTINKGCVVYSACALVAAWAWR